MQLLPDAPGEESVILSVGWGIVTAFKKISLLVLRWSVAKLSILLSVVALIPWLLVTLLLVQPLTDPMAWLFSSKQIVLPFAILILSALGYGLSATMLLALAVRLREHGISQLVNPMHKLQEDLHIRNGLKEVDPAIRAIIARTYEISARHRALNAINQRISSCTQLEVILPEISKNAVELLGATSGSVALSTEGGISHNIGLHNLPELLRVLAPKSMSVAGEVIERGQTVIVEDYSKYERRLELLDAYGFKAVLGIPLVAEGQLIGALVVATPDPTRRFTQEDVEVLTAFGNQAAIAIGNARIHTENCQRLEELRCAKKELASTTDQLRRLLSKTFNKEEEVRKQISADIHDGITQLVVGALCQVQSVKPLVILRSLDGLEIAANRLDTAHNLLNQAVDEMHRVIYNLRPPYLDEGSVVHALQRYLEMCEVASGLKCHLELIGAERDLGPEKQLTIYRIVQEALNNVLKHSGTLTANVHVHFHGEMVTVTIQDCGRGFEKACHLYRHGERLGITDMEERAHSVGGSLQVSSVSGQGTVVVLEIPFNQREAVIEKALIDEPETGGRQRTNLAGIGARDKRLA